MDISQIVCGLPPCPQRSVNHRKEIADVCVISHGCMDGSVKENVFESRSGLDRLMLYFAPQIAAARRKAEMKFCCCIYLT